MSSTATAIAVEARASLIWNTFARWFCHPRVVIDGKVHHVPWGSHSFPVTPGSHTIEIFFKYLMIETCGRATVRMTVAEGETKRLNPDFPDGLLN